MKGVKGVKGGRKGVKGVKEGRKGVKSVKGVKGILCLAGGKEYNSVAVERRRGSSVDGGDGRSRGMKGEKGEKGLKGAKGFRGAKGLKGGAAERFEDLHVYQRARELTNAIYRLTRAGTFARDFGLVDQIRRAAVSIMSNIAEGFERGSTTELIQYLYIAKGSCGEVRAQLAIACDQGYVARSDYDSLHDLARRVSGMLSNFIAHLQGSNYRGEKFARPARLAGKDTWFQDFCDRHGVRPPNYGPDGDVE